jgi:hypothetical protein
MNFPRAAFRPSARLVPAFTFLSLPASNGVDGEPWRPGARSWSRLMPKDLANEIAGPRLARGVEDFLGLAHLDHFSVGHKYNLG